jgi:hypothetical protein
LALESERYNITWHTAVIRLGQRGINFISLGLCEHTQRTAFVAIFNPDKPATQEALRTLLVKDVYAGQNGCEDGTRCLDLNCPMNKAKPENFKQYKIDTTEKLSNFSKNMQKFRSDLKLQINPKGGNYYYEKPLLIIKKNKGKTAVGK